jgi:protein-tyrosine-phosphatase
MMKKLLFVCVENSNRSQMSQAFAKMIGGLDVEAFSAGSATTSFAPHANKRPISILMRYFTIPKMIGSGLLALSQFEAILALGKLQRRG